MVTLKDLQHSYQSCLSGFNVCELSPIIFPHSWWCYQFPAQLWRISPEILQSSGSCGHPRRAEGSGPCVLPEGQESLSRGPEVKSWGSQVKWKIYLTFICSPLWFFKLAVYLQSNGEKTLKLLWEHCREKTKEFGSSWATGHAPVFLRRPCWQQFEPKGCGRSG